ncbi:MULTISPECIES: M50 family metallopeptidase [Clostridium]|uniref:M50 family metallopeptidase n=1 Tax=Clostridium TaxID=1485 RepID=UPI000826F116|nr:MULTISPECIES: M50 family metallopeptidase [Clostridium]PJI10293.1 metalloprotease [Clostridium sp. CT7]
MFKLSKYFIPYIIILFIIGFNGELFYVFIFVLLHEITHYLTARILGFSGFDIEILPFGAVLKLKDIEYATEREDFIISLSGPLLNLILAAIFYVLFKNNFGYKVYSLCIINFSLGIFNLMPAFPLDGGRLLRDMLSCKLNYRKSNEITIGVSIFIGIIFCIFSLIGVFFNIKNLNMLVVAFFILFCSFKEKGRMVYIVMGDILRKKIIFLRKGYIENRMISVSDQNNLINSLKIMDKNKYTVFTVLNEEMKVIDLIYEEEILDALKNYGNITFGELVSLRERND